MHPTRVTRPLSLSLAISLSLPLSRSLPPSLTRNTETHKHSLSLLVFARVSVRRTNIPLFHWVTNVAAKVIVISILRTDCPKHKKLIIKIKHLLPPRDSDMCSHVQALRHRWPNCTKAHIKLGFGRDLSTAVLSSQHIRLSRTPPWPPTQQPLPPPPP